MALTSSTLDTVKSNQLPISYPRQVKVAEQGEFVHLRIFENLPCYGGGVYLHGVLHHHQIGDSDVDYFDQNMNFDQPQWDD